MSEGTATVEVERLDAVYLIPDEHRSPETVRWRFDRVARTRLEQGFARALDAVVDGTDESVWLVRELEVELAVDATDENEDRVAAAWAEALAGALADTLERGPDGDRVRRFTNRGEYTAAFVEDLARGRGRDAWFYEPFETLRALTTGAAIREALARDPPIGWAALALLASRGRRELVLAALSDAETRGLADSLAPPCAADLAALEAVVAEWAVVVTAADGGLSTSANVLRLLVAVAASGTAPAAAAGTVRTLLAVADALKAARADELLPRLLDGELVRPAELIHVTGRGEDASALSLFAELARRDPALASRVAETITGDGRVGPRRGSSLGTAYSGIFLLLQGLIDLDLDGVLAPLTPPGTDPAALRLALLAHCAGTSAALTDAGVRLAAGAAPGSVAAQADPVGDEHAQRVLLERLARLGRAEGRFLVLDTVEIAKRRFRPWLERRGDVREELAALAFDGEAVPAALLLAARAALRELAARLVGLEWSGAAYLQHNFVAGAGTVRVDGRAFEVELPASPLQIVLQLAGVHGRVIDVPWLGEVTLTLPTS